MLNPFVTKLVYDARILVPSTAGGILVLAANPRRLYALIVNESNVGIYLKLGSQPTSTTDGIYIAPNGFAYETDRGGGNLFQGAIYAIRPSGGAGKYVTAHEEW
jgi:hypothetical protein